eukprot:21489-Alexandrium_andersonii.AAC.1
MAAASATSQGGRRSWAMRSAGSCACRPGASATWCWRTSWRSSRPRACSACLLYTSDAADDM